MADCRVCYTLGMTENDETPAVPLPEHVQAAAQEAEEDRIEPPLVPLGGEPEVSQNENFS